MTIAGGETWFFDTDTGVWIPPIEGLDELMVLEQGPRVENEQGLQDLAGFLGWARTEGLL